MLQSQWTSDGLKLVEVDPGPLRQGWTRIKVEACGICGSDLHIYSGKMPKPDGLVLGHEMVGTIIDGGPGLADSLYGIEPFIPCFDCQQCATGNTQICPNHKFIGLGEPGGLAETLDVPQFTLHPVDPSIPPLQASLVEPMACSYRGVQLGRLQLESRVLVLGAGTIGLLAGLLARDRATEVAITARHPQQRDAARRLGLTPLGEDSWQDWARDREPDVVIETVGGKADTFNVAIEACQRAGRIVIVGIYTEMSEVDGLKLVLKEVEVVGSSMYGPGLHGREFASTLDYLLRYRSEIEFIQTHQFPLKSVDEAFACAMDKGTGAVKVTVLPG